MKQKIFKLLILIGFMSPVIVQAQISDVLYASIGISEEFQSFRDYKQTFDFETSDANAVTQFATIAYLGAWYQPNPVLGVRAHVGYAMLFGEYQRKEFVADVQLVFDVSPVWNYDSNTRLLVLSGPMYYYVPPMGDLTRGNAFGAYLGLQLLSQKSHFSITPYGKLGFNSHSNMMNTFGVNVAYYIGQIDTWNP